MSRSEMLAAKEAERDTLVGRATELLGKDARVVAAWLAGSLGRGEGDAWSDVDLWVVVEDAFMQVIGEGRRQFVEVLGQPILISEAPQNAPPGGAYLWALYSGEYGPQHVDWNMLPQTGAAVPADAAMLFDHAGLPREGAMPRVRPTGEELTAALTQGCAFFWAMSTVVAKYIARGKAFEALNLMNIAGDTLNKVEWLLGLEARWTYRDNAWGHALAPFGGEEQLALLRGLAGKMQGLHSRITEAGGRVPGEAIGEISRLMELVEGVVEGRV